MAVTEKLTRKQRRLLRQTQKEIEENKTPFEIKKIKPLTENQSIAFDAYEAGKNLMLHGIAGTGKSFLSLYLSLKEVMESNNSYHKVVIVRSVVPTRDMGFLPGNNKEKSKVYELPYYAICTELFGRGDAYEILKHRNMIDFISTSFIRGITLNNCIIVVDEMQNMTLHELDSIITRVGKNCKIIFSGDFRQSDFTREHEKSGIVDFMRVIEKMNAFEFIDFDENDIVRSGLVKSYIIAKDRLGVIA